MLREEKIVEVLEAFDLTESYRAAGLLCGVDHHTVRRYVLARAAGLDPTRVVERVRGVDPFAEKILEWIERSNGRIRADVVHRRLVAMGYRAGERTTRRVVAAMKATWAGDHRRVYKPWIPEPGLWLQWDYGDGPTVEGVRSVLFCAWLAWSRFRVIRPLRDRRMGSVIAALDAAFRAVGGVPTYALTDNEKTVTDRHVAGIAVRNTEIVSVAQYYGLSIVTCVPYDPETKGGSEATVRIAKADLVPTETNLRDRYGSWAELDAACAETMAWFNGRSHAVTGEAPVVRLERERPFLHRAPAEAYTAAFGESRAVSWSSTVAFRGARYSVPHRLGGQRVWVRVDGDQVVIVAGQSSAGPTAEVARHRLLGRGEASIIDAHYPPRRSDPIHREPKATKSSEAEFLAIGVGAARWLVEAAAIGTRRIEERMAEAVQLCRFFDPAAVDDALGVAALVGRFADGDLVSILAARSPEPRWPGTEHSLQPGTSVWKGLGQ